MLVTKTNVNNNTDLKQGPIPFVFSLRFDCSGLVLSFIFKHGPRLLDNVGDFLCYALSLPFNDRS